MLFQRQFIHCAMAISFIVLSPSLFFFILWQGVNLAFEGDDSLMSHLMVHRDGHGTEAFWRCTHLCRFETLEWRGVAWISPIAKVEETLGQLNGATIFSKLDANSGFWQIQLARKSKLLTTFITPFGRYYFNKLPSGISSALELFQKRINSYNIVRP